MITPDALEEELTRLHGQLEHAARLSQLHEAAAEMFGDDAGSARFHLTHAWVYALVDGEEQRIAMLEARLQAMGGL